jgi:SNF2 family DNA or RNA helicase
MNKLNNNWDCLNFKSIKLQEHQKYPSAFITKPKNRGILLFYSVGTGKTITSIAMLRCLLEKFPNKNAIVLTPASLTGNYLNELDRVAEDISLVRNRIHVHSYVKFINNIKTDEQASVNTILVIDESQNFLSPNSIRYKKLFNFSKTAYKVILLSGTPVRNNIGEISNELSLLNGVRVKKSLIEKINDFPDETQRLVSLKNFLGCKIAFYDKSKKSQDFPERIDHTVKLAMGRSYYETYHKIQENIKTELHSTFKTTENLKAFLNGIRKASNVVLDPEGSPKIKWTINKIVSDLKFGKKVLVYSNWLSAGVTLITDELKKLDINYSLITGKQTQKQKEDNIKKYNDNKVKVIIISSSGAEGLNLKKTRTVIIMERSWNNAKLDQVIGRAIRLNSHLGLPENQKKVDVYNLMLVKPEHRIKGDIYLGSADEILNSISNKKSHLIKDFYTYVKKLSIGRHPECF